MLKKEYIPSEDLVRSFQKSAHTYTILNNFQQVLREPLAPVGRHSRPRVSQVFQLLLLIGTL